MRGANEPAIDSGQVQWYSLLTCPACGTKTEERMPADFCQIRYQCPACGAELRPKPGDCCVFCSYGTVPCPPEQRAARD